VNRITTTLERFSSMSILVVDDHPENLALVEQVLRRAGMRHLTMLQDSRRVEGMLGDVAPDLVLLDLHMPGLDGYQVLEQVVQFAAGSYLPVLVLTADASTRARNQALSRGARDFLTKPLDVTELTLRVGNLLETRQLCQNLLGDAEQGRDRAAFEASTKAASAGWPRPPDNWSKLEAVPRVDRERVSLGLFGRKCRLPLAIWVLGHPTGRVFQSEPPISLGPRTALRQELERFRDVGLLEEVRPDDETRVYYVRTSSPLWRIIETAIEVVEL
jgi:CheY-like chemotaxis protein